MSQTGGGQANLTGHTLERMVDALLQQHNYKKLPNRQFGVHLTNPRPVYFRQLAIAKTIYDTDMKVDFFVYSPTKHPRGLVIECKWQQSKGSVDEKYPYLIENLSRLSEPAIIVLDGGGYKPGARRWLQRASGNAPQVSLFGLAGFTRWANGGGL